MCVDVEPGMWTLAAVAWEPAAKISLVVLALFFSIERVAAACIAAAPGVAARAAAAAAVAAAAGVAAARGGGGPHEAIRLSGWWSRIV